MDVVNRTAFTSPLANARYVPLSQNGIVERIYAGLNVWTILLSLLLVAVTYDQRGSNEASHRAEEGHEC